MSLILIQYDLVLIGLHLQRPYLGIHIHRYQGLGLEHIFLGNEIQPRTLGIKPIIFLLSLSPILYKEYWWLFEFSLSFLVGQSSYRSVNFADAVNFVIWF